MDLMHWVIQATEKCLVYAADVSFIVLHMFQQCHVNTTQQILS